MISFDVIPDKWTYATLVAVYCRAGAIDEALKSFKEAQEKNISLDVPSHILEGDCDTAIGVFSNISGNNISMSAELFSVDGKHRYLIKETKEINFAKELGREVGEKLKFQSKGSYKR
jgi:hydroxymethylbilane synthase